MKNGIIQKDGKSYIESKVVMLATKEQSQIFIEDDGRFTFYKHKQRPSLTGAGQNLYFLSDEEIKEGDWFLLKGKFIKKCYKTNKHEVFYDNDRQTYDLDDKIFCKKIIATTDESLKIFDVEGSDEVGAPNYKSLPRPSNEFLRAYCNVGEEIDGVLVEVEDDYHDFPVESYHIKVALDNTITIKKVEDNPDLDYVGILALSTKQKKEDIARQLKHGRHSYTAQEVISAMRFLKENLDA